MSTLLENQEEHYSLEPCPFCGSAAKMNTDVMGAIIFCPNEGTCCAPSTGWRKIDEAIDVWNKRA